jgi:CBS domain-containing protein
LEHLKAASPIGLVGYFMAMATTAKDIYAQQFNTVHENEAASRCLEGFKKGLPPVMAVLDDRDRYIGMVTRRSVLRSRLDLSRTKVKSFMTVAPEVSPMDSLGRIAKLMIGSGVRQLPVTDKGRIVGFVTDEGVIHAVAGGPWGSNKIDSIMTRAPHTLEANRTVGAVLSLMREFGVSHVPIMERGKLAGLISIQDIIQNLYFPLKRMGNQDVAGEQITTLNVPAKGIMSAPVITVTPQALLRDAEKLMHDQDISCLCVIEEDHLIGIVTKLDFLEPISEMETPERRFTVQFGTKEVEVSSDQQQYMMAEFDSFTRRFQDTFQLGNLFVYMKTHRGTNQRETPMVHCRLQFRTTKGSYYATSEGWGVEPTFKVALERLERRLLRSKELIGYNPKYARDYLRKIGIPQEE